MAALRAPASRNALQDPGSLPSLVNELKELETGLESLMKMTPIPVDGCATACMLQVCVTSLRITKCDH